MSPIGISNPPAIRSSWEDDVAVVSQHQATNIDGCDNCTTEGISVVEVSDEVTPIVNPNILGSCQTEEHDSSFEVTEKCDVQFQAASIDSCTTGDILVVEVCDEVAPVVKGVKYVDEDVPDSCPNELHDTSLDIIKTHDVQFYKDDSGIKKLEERKEFSLVLKEKKESQFVGVPPLVCKPQPHKMSRLHMLEEEAKKNNFIGVSKFYKSGEECVITSLLKLLCPEKNTIEIETILATKTKPFSGKPVSKNFKKMMSCAFPVNGSLQHFKVPLEVSQEHLSSFKLWACGGSANLINTLILAYILDKNVVVVDFSRSMSNYYRILPNLECQHYSDIAYLERACCQCGERPIFVIPEMDALFIFLDSGIEKGYWYRVKGLITSFEYIYSDSQVCSSCLNINDSGDGVFRLVPTYSGSTLQHFKSEDELYNLDNYLAYIGVVANEVLTIEKDAEKKKKQEQDPNLPYYLYTSFCGETFEQPGSMGSRFLVDISSLNESHGLWLEKVYQLKSFAIKRDSDGDCFSQIRDDLLDVQKSYKNEKDQSKKEKMFHVLAEVPFNLRLRNIVAIEYQLFSWMEVLGSMDPKKHKLGGVSDFEAKKRFELAEKSIKKIVEKASLEDVSLSRINSALTQLDHESVPKDVFDEYCKRLKGLILDFLKSRDDLETPDWDIYDLVIEKMNKSYQNKKKVFTLLPENSKGMEEWLKNLDFFGMYSREEQTMFLCNAEALHRVLKCRDNVAPAVHDSLDLVREGAKVNPYRVSSLYTWKSFIIDYFRDVQLLPCLSDDTSRRFYLYLPVIKEEVFGRLWPHENTMQKSLKPALLSLLESSSSRLEPKPAGKPPQEKSRDVVVSRKDLKILKEEMTARIDKDGICIAVSDGKEVKLQSSFMKVSTYSRKATPRTCCKVVTDALDMEPGKFRVVWGERKKEADRLEA